MVALRHKLPTRTAYDDRWEETLEVDLSLLTGAKGFKRARKSTELDMYFDTLAEDLVGVNAEGKDPLINRPLD